MQILQEIKWILLLCQFKPKIEKYPSELICEAAVVSVQAKILKTKFSELISDAAVVSVQAAN